MSDKTYIELCKDNISTVQIQVWRDNGTAFTPVSASYQVKGSKKDNTIIPYAPANVDGNKVYTQLSLTVTASAAEYDLYWKLFKNGGDIANHCTKVLVIDTC